MKATFIFLALAGAMCAAMFGDALRGRSLLAPVDIAPALWPQYRFVDPASNGIPQNHFVVDQLGYDLPLQWTLWHAWRRGEVPWWDPFTYGGRPLLADAHVSATDPVRIVCYLAFGRFELAYNWTLLAHSIGMGLGVFFLLRRLGVSAQIGAITGLLAMFAGSSGIFFSHPWIPASFLFYPWLWLAWHSLWEKPGGVARLAAPLLAAGALYAGNLQSHSYLVLFAVAFCAGYAGRNRESWWRAVRVVVPTGALAALLAAPVLWPQIELFARNLRPLQSAAPDYRFFDGPLVFSALWPWSTGTFRSLTRSIIGFHVFIGTAGFLLALLGARSAPGPAGARRCAIVLVLGFVAIMTLPPLARIFYARAAGLATLGALVLAALGAEWLRGCAVPRPRLARATLALALLFVAGTGAVVWIIYPKLKPALLAKMEAHALADGTDGRSLTLRRFQVENYPREVSFTNPEVLAAWLTLPALAILALVPRWRRVGVPALLVLNLIAPVLFARRFIPRAPIEQWQRLLAGGPLQQEARALVEARRLRLHDESSTAFTTVFPQNLAHLYGVHGVYGYAALVPPNLAWSNAGRTGADYVFTDGKFEQLRTEGDARFSWIGEPRRKITLVAESLNAVTLDVAAGSAGWLLRTDTRYPGWRAFAADGAPLSIASEGEVFTRIQVPSGPTRVVLRYRPTGLTGALALAALGLCGAGVWAARRRET